jgi:hypothetical protein
MKRILKILALLVLLGTAGTWLATGANRGWTKTSQQVKTLDPVTGIEGITYEPKFLPGVDFLAVGVFGTLVLGGASLFVRSKTNNH